MLESVSSKTISTDRLRGGPKRNGPSLGGEVTGAVIAAGATWGHQAAESERRSLPVVPEFIAGLF